MSQDLDESSKPAMLRATEQLTWIAKLQKFDRGQSKPTAAGRPAGGSGADDFLWQHFSGDHLSCKVLFTQPSDKRWPTIDASEEKGVKSLTRQPADERQLRIIVECGSTELNEDDPLMGNRGHVGSSAAAEGGRVGTNEKATASSQSRRPIVLEDVDLVRINKSYFFSERRLDAVVAVHRNLLVGIRYLDEHDVTRAYRIQLTFTKEADKDFFLTLIAPDSSIRPIASAVPPEQASKEAHSKTETKTEVVAKGPEPVKPECHKETVGESQPDSQGLLEQLVQMATSRILGSLSATGPENPQRGIGSCSSSASQDASNKAQDAQNTTIDRIAQRASFQSSPEINMARDSQAPMETLKTDAGEKGLEDSDEEVAGEGVYGWPDPSAVECIRHDVRRLCLSDPGLESIIARSVEKYLEGDSGFLDDEL